MDQKESMLPDKLAIAARLEPVQLGTRLVVKELEPVLDDIVTAFERLRDTPEVTRSHYFEGRYENIYINREAIPQLEPVLELAVAAAQLISGERLAPQLGFWFNEMQPGARTLMHTHDDADEILSGVFYVKTPRNSGNLLLGQGAGQISLEPIETAFVFFPPGLPHAVETNRSNAMRLSIGMNFGIRGEQE